MAKAISRRKLLLGVTSAIAASAIDFKLDFAGLSNGLEILLSGVSKASAEDKKETTGTENTSGYADDKTNTPNTEPSAVYLPNLEAYVDALKLFSNPEEKQRFLAAYDSKQDYQALFTNLAKQITQLDVVKYASDHTLDFRFKFENVSFKRIDYSSDPKINESINLCYDRDTGVMVSYEKREVYEGEFNKLKKHTSYRYYIDGNFFREYRISAKKGNVYSDEFEEVMINHLFYAAYHLLQQAYNNASKLNDEWKQKPWREFIGTAHDEKKCYGKKPNNYHKMYGGYNSKTKELVFLGTNWCEPCKVIASHLLKNKIRFREKENDVDGSSPRMWSGCYNLYGSEEIIQAINKMYNLTD